MALPTLIAHLVKAKIVPMRGGLYEYGMIVEGMDFLLASNSALGSSVTAMPPNVGPIRYSALELAHLAASMVEAGMLKGVSRISDGKGGDIPIAADVQCVVERAKGFLYSCGIQLNSRKAYWMEAKKVGECEEWGAAHLAANKRVPIEKVIEKAGLAGPTLNRDQLESLGCVTEWKALSSQDRALAMFRFLARETPVCDDGMHRPGHSGRTLVKFRAPMKIGESAELEDMAQNGVKPELLARVLDFLQQAKELKEKRQHKVAAAKSVAARKKPLDSDSRKKEQNG